MTDEQILEQVAEIIHAIPGYEDAVVNRRMQLSQFSEAELEELWGGVFDRFGLVIYGHVEDRCKTVQRVCGAIREASLRTAAHAGSGTDY